MRIERNVRALTNANTSVTSAITNVWDFGLLSVAIVIQVTIYYQTKGHASVKIPAMRKRSATGFGRTPMSNVDAKNAQTAN